MGIFSRVREANAVIESAKKEIDCRHQNDEVARRREQKQGKR